MNDLERYYYRQELPKVRKQIQEHKAGMGNVGKCMRLSSLYERLFDLEGERSDRLRRYEEARNLSYENRALIASCIPGIEEEIRKIKREITFIVKGAKQPQRKQEITYEMIEQARQYPLESFIEIKRGLALCPFHDDRNPSMGIKRNRFHCFACGAKGDVIDFVMKRDGLSFRETVKALA